MWRAMPLLIVILSAGLNYGLSLWSLANGTYHMMYLLPDLVIFPVLIYLQVRWWMESNEV